MRTSPGSSSDGGDALRPPGHWPRAILHVDMDAFFASVEELDNPALRGKPLLVGGSPKTRGVVAAASYAARAFGCHSAMSMARALRLCPHAIVLPGRMERYAEISLHIRDIFETFTPLVAPVSVDEAFLDVTGSQRLFGTPREIGLGVKDRIRAETGLTASVGIAPTRFVAKIASDLEKPDGLVLIPEAEVLDRLAPLPVRRIWGVGGKTAGKLGRLGIETIGDLRRWPREELARAFGTHGAALYDLARGVDTSEVAPREREKSVSNEVTFARDITTRAEVESALLALADKVAGRLRRKGMRGRVVQIKVRYDDFSTITRRLTLEEPHDTARTLYREGVRLLRERTDAGTRPVRLVGIGYGNLSPAEAGQGELFATSAEGEEEQAERLERTTDAIRAKLGNGSVGRASLLGKLDRRNRPKRRPDGSDPRTDATEKETSEPRAGRRKRRKRR